ncbi:hypothetical protein [Pontibacter harenae]|uniref:hypothetical protein n=1 Tax=Pontibacter harenae TaxID=2894083 RepID=UPI001E36784B|nr:hypothetical protein [Pontibacter harenae]MCC9165622.1 hypothetical protein [Pontibacter harenae]
MKKLLFSSALVLICSSLSFAQPSITGSMKPEGTESYLSSVKLHFNNVEELQEYKWDELESVLSRSKDAIRKDFKLVISADVNKEKYRNKNIIPDSFTVKVSEEKDTTKLIREAQRGVEKMLAILIEEDPK